jgi:thiol-disulfide isomerase/thioredoxin
LLASILLLAAGTASASVREAASVAAVMNEFGEKPRIRVVNVWATWCAPCVAEMADLQKIASRFRDRGVAVVGVSLDDALPGDRTEAKRRVDQFLEKHQIRFANLYFTGRTTELTEALAFDGSIPITIIFDWRGKEIARASGKLDPAKFTRKLEELTAKK